jgi:hypothetical protein
MLARRSKSSNSDFWQGADALKASALLRIVFCLVFQVVTRDDKKEHSAQLKTPNARNQVHEMLSFVF